MADAALQERPASPLKAQLQEAAERYKSQAEALSQKRRAREANLGTHRPGEADLRKFDSSVKRNTALVKRLRQLSEDTAGSILEDVARTNQSKYISEAAAAVAEATLKPKDLDAALQVCTVLHQRYEDFGTELARKLAQQAIPAGDDRSGAPRRRTALRLLVEVVTSGIAVDAAPLVDAVICLAARIPTRQAHVPGGGAGTPAAWQVQVLPLLAAFAKAGREQLLCLPALHPPTSTAPEGDMLDAELQQLQQHLAHAAKAWQEETSAQWHLPGPPANKLLVAITATFELACAALTSEHSSLIAAEENVQRVLNHRGDVPEDMGMAYEQQRRAFESLHKSTAALGEVLDKPLPHLPQANLTRMATSNAVTAISMKVSETTPDGPFDDGQTRAFYEVLPDLSGIVPPVLLPDAAKLALAPEDDTDSPIATQSSEGALRGSDAGMPDGQEDAGLAAAAQADVVDTDKPNAAGQSLGDVRAETAAMLAQLPSLTTVAGCDTLAANLACVCSKAMRKRLVKALVTLKASALQLLPFYVRVGATLNALFPDIGQGLVRHAESTFTSLQARRDGSQQHLQDRISTARLLAELVKFRILPLGAFFTMLKALLDDFAGPNVDTAAALVENAGRFLYLLPEGHTRMANMLEVMKKMKGGKGLDARQRMLLDDAAFACVPPATTAARAKARPPLQAYMRHLVLKGLWIDDTKKVQRKLRRFPWAEHEAYLVRCLLRTVKGGYARVATTASLVASLSRYHPSLSVALADCLLEEVRAGLEAPKAGGYQRRIGHMQLLGELYNYRVIDSRVVFDTLYLLLELGHDTPEAAQRLDPPDNFFRIRLVRQLLQACGHYFSRGSACARLNRFFAFLQRYILAKPSLPFDIEFDIQELFESLRPDLVRHDSYEEACLEVDAIQAAEAERRALDTIDEDDDEEDEDSRSLARSRNGSSQGDLAGSAEALAPDADDDQAVKVLHAFRSEAAGEDPAFERDLAAVMGARSAAAGPGTRPGTEPDGSAVPFQVVLRRSGGREAHSRTVQLPGHLAIAVSQQAKAAAEAAERAEMKRLGALMAQEPSAQPHQDGAADGSPADGGECPIGYDSSGRLTSISWSWSTMIQLDGARQLLITWAGSRAAK
ncbi:hypothetical protein WJX73_010709 [Symbiochloris irregularis]|uniref:MIF4G domain-containing protein n=1 Tax=Symbiochloris irregularis TaxID=706552 RepID=A0AAW1PMQ8_9CHLO